MRNLNEEELKVAKPLMNAMLIARANLNKAIADLAALVVPLKIKCGISQGANINEEGKWVNVVTLPDGTQKEELLVVDPKKQ